MADFTFTSPEGKQYTVSGDGTKEEAFQKLQQHLQSGSAGAAAVGGAIKGLPVVGPALFKGAEYAAGGIRSLATGEPFKESLGKVSQRAESTFATHPTAETAGEIGGGIAGTGAMVAAAPELMGVTGTLPGMIARGAASGGAIGAADAAARGENVGTAAIIGTAAGGLGPVAGKIGGALAEPVLSAYRSYKDPATEAARRAAAAVWKDVEQRKGQLVQRAEQGARESEYQRAAKAGQPVMAMDVGGETTRALAKSAANISPEARSVLSQATNQRYEQQAQRFSDWMSSNFHFPDAAKQQESLDRIATTVNRANYEEAYTRGSFDLFAASPKIQQLAGSDVVSAAIGASRKAQKDQMILSSLGMAGTVGKPVAVSGTMDLRFWDGVHKQLQDAAIRAGRGTNEARVIGGFDRELKAELDRLVPKYQAARAGAAQMFRADNALEAGQKAVTIKMGNDQMRAALIKMSPLERQLFQDGYIDRLRNTIREHGYRRNVADKVIFSDAAKERLEMVIGRPKAMELETFVRMERMMDFARKAVQGGSPTAQYLSEIGMAAGAAAGTEAYELWQGNKWNDPTSLWVGILTGAATRGKHAINQSVAIQLAHLLTSQDLGQVKRAISIIANNKTLSQAVKNADAAIGATVTRGVAGPAVRSMMQPGSPQQEPQQELQYGGPQQ